MIARHGFGYVLMDQGRWKHGWFIDPLVIDDA
jgi:hypothetical protein